MQRQTDHAQNSNPTKKARLAECLKIINGIMIYIKPTTPDTNTNTKTKAKKHSSTDVITTLHHVLYYLKMELDRISSSPTNLDLMLNYILNDLKAVATKTDNLVRKYDKTFWSSHVKRKKYEYKITLMDNRLHYIYTLLSYYFTNKIDDKTKTYSFSAPYVISDKEAAEFWTRNFGDNYWYKEYDPFCDAIKTKNEKAYKMLTSNSDKTMKYPQVVTAISFGLATDKGFKAFFNGLSYNNPFLVPASTASDPDPTAIPEDTGNDAERESEYFYIFSRCITEDKRKYCVQVSGK